MVRDLESLSNDVLILSPEYIKLPQVKREDIVVKDYEPLDGSSDLMPFRDEVYSDIIARGAGEKSTNNFVYAVIEAVQNAQEHSYKWKKYDADGNINLITVAGFFTPIYNLIEVSSKGNIDIDKIRNLISENEKIRYDSRGRGFFSMTKICDVVYPYQGEGNLEVMLILMKDKFYEKAE